MNSSFIIILQFCTVYAKVTKFYMPVNRYDMGTSLHSISTARSCARSCGCTTIEMLHEGGYRRLEEYEEANVDPADLLLKGNNISYITLLSANVHISII